MDFARTRIYFFLTSFILVGILFFYILKPFLFTIFWAAVLATLFNPVYLRFNSYFRNKRPNVSALITLLIVIIVILLPLSLISTLVVRESISVYEYLSDGKLNELIRGTTEFLRTNPLLSRLNIDNNVITQQLNDIGRNVITWVYETAKVFTQNSLKFLALFILMLYTLFFFLRDGEKIIQKAIRLFPLGDRYEKLLFNKFTYTISATIKGTLVVGSVQGILGGLMFAATGVPSPLIFGILMGIFAIIPVTGTGIVWGPTGLVMILTGHVWQGIVILAVGTLVISTIDNFLRPILVGKDLRMHPVVILFSTLGGVALFGISGLVVGPVIASLFQSFWEIYEDYYNKELVKT